MAVNLNRTRTPAAIPSLSPSYYYIGHYKVTPLLTPATVGKVSIVDTRTGEGGAFDIDAVTRTLEDALDTFFCENY